MNYFSPKEPKATRQAKSEKRRSLFRRIGPFQAPRPLLAWTASEMALG